METLEQIIDACVRLYLDLEPHGDGQFVVKPVWLNATKQADSFTAEIGACAAKGKTVKEAADALHGMLIKSARQRVEMLKEYL